MNVNLTCLQALARQALICTYFCYHATDFDTLRTSCLILSVITILDFNVHSLHNACELCISSVPRDGSHLSIWVRWQTYLRYFRIMCYNTQAVPIFQGLNFLYATLLNLRFFNWPQGFWKICGTQPKSVHVIHTLKRICESTCRLVWCVLINWCAQNIQNL